MKILLLISTLIAAACAAKIFDEDFEKFQEEEHMKVIGDKDAVDEAKDNFEKAEKQINDNNEKFNKGESTFEEKLYPESILPKKEFEKEKEGLLPDKGRNRRFKIVRSSRSMGYISPPESERTGPKNDAALAKIDARMVRNRQANSYNSVELGLVTDVKSQGSCGSCVAFAAQGLHEVCMIKAGVKKDGLDLSEQYLVDCGYDGKTAFGCNGASPSSYTNWMINNANGQAPHENSYAYVSGTTKKRQDCNQTVGTWNSGAKVASFNQASAYGEERLKSIVASNGAALVGVYASDTSFDNYASGIFQGCSSTTANHAVLVVGYGTENGVDYWLVKNSWGTNWGESGYFRIKRGSNECGIENENMVYVECSATGSSDETPAEPEQPEQPEEPEVPEAETCDMSSWLGTGWNGNFTFTFISGDNVYESKISCTNSICKPQNPEGIKNACVYICGEATCA